MNLGGVCKNLIIRGTIQQVGKWVREGGRGGYLF